MRTASKLLFLGIASTLAALPQTGIAQDASPKPPNVMFVLDTSRAMALSASAGTEKYPDCTKAEQSRWAVVQQALTGTYNGFQCTTSGTADFKNGGSHLNLEDIDPTDLFNYQLSGTQSDFDTAGGSCKPTFKCTAGSPDYAFPSGLIDYSGSCKKNPANFQDSNGVLDVFANTIRFGMMTFDDSWDDATDDGAGAGPYSFYFSIPSRTRFKNLTGNKEHGGYSYWYTTASQNWMGGGGSATGKYTDVSFAGLGVEKMKMNKRPWEVGVRNIDAPVCEGRMMGFGSATSTAALTLQADREQQVILLTNVRDRANESNYAFDWANSKAPIAGAMSDVTDFYENDVSVIATDYPNPGDKNYQLGPSLDCRNSAVVLITGSVPSDDMRHPMSDGYECRWFTKTSDFSAITDLLELAAVTGLFNTYYCSYLSHQEYTKSTFPIVYTLDLVNTGNPNGGPGSCDQAAGQCPYSTPGTYAKKLADDKKALTYAIGVGGTIDFKPPSSTQCTHGWKWNGGTGVCTANCNDIKGTPASPTDDFVTDYICGGGLGNWQYPQAARCCELFDIQTGISATTGTLAPPIFVSSEAELRANLSIIMSVVSSLTSTRTTPVFATAAPSLNTVGNVNPNNAGKDYAAGYEILSSLVSKSGNGEWAGHLERRRITCDTTGQPVNNDVDSSKGDSFQTNLQYQASKDARAVFTVVSGLSPAVQDGTLRRGDEVSYSDPLSPTNHPNDDGLQGEEVDFGYQTKYPSANVAGSTASNLPGAINAALGLTGSSQKVEDLLGVSDLGVCKTLFGVSTASACATDAIESFLGVSLGKLSDRQVAMGAIYHSNPVVIGPPLDALQDESYRNTFAPGNAGRPTIAYAGTLDGQLHAFVVENNAPWTNVPDTNTDQSYSELWSFIPPAALPTVWKSFNAAANVLDGPIAVSDVILNRSLGQLNGGSGTWRTVLVGSGGNSTNISNGGYYFALDVTDPTAPEFLWQLHTDKNGGKLFGDATPGAVITTVNINEPGTTTVEQVAVAILAGGTSNAAPNPPVDRSCTSIVSTPAICPDETDTTPNQPKHRKKVWDWGSAEPARTVTVVELQTGKIIQRFHGQAGDTPTAVNAKSSPKLSKQAGFDSPMSGTPVVYPATPGVATSRAYIGDQDGTLWRLDLTNADPEKWTASLAVDMYPDDADGYKAGQPIEVPPVLTADAQANPVVVFATGKQDGFNVAPQDGYEPVNYITSFTDYPAADLSGDLNGTFAAGVIGDLSWNTGKRVTGPMTIFNGVLYFATYDPNPPTKTDCSGFPEIYGVDYLHVATAPTFANGLDTDGNGVADASSTKLEPGDVVFGVAVNRLASCGGTTSAPFSDGWLAGSYSTETTSASKYQLVFQTAGVSAGGDLSKGALDDKVAQATSTTQTLHVNVSTPSSTVRIDSWTAVAE